MALNITKCQIAPCYEIHYTSDVVRCAMFPENAPFNFYGKENKLKLKRPKAQLIEF